MRWCLLVLGGVLMLGCSVDWPADARFACAGPGGEGCADWGAAPKCIDEASCDDDNPCTQDVCDPKAGCVHEAKSGPCDDGDACTVGDACAGGSCKSGSQKSCDDGHPCTADTCSASTGACSHAALSYGACCAALGGKSGGACIWTDSAGRKWGLVPAGSFYMGCNAALDKLCKEHEKPQHKVTITKPFWLGLYEVTVDEYKACVAAGQCAAPSQGADYIHSWCKPGLQYANWSTSGPVSGRGSHPLNCVTWSRAQSYCTWLGGTLPTEAQWELAARGRCEENGGVSGCASKMRVYPWGSASPVCGKHAVFSPSSEWGCGQGGTWSVGSGSGQGAGPYGHFDLSGNVWEWAWDCWDGGFYGKAAATQPDPVNKSCSPFRGHRGGGFAHAQSTLRSGSRYAFTASFASFNIGLRCARSYP